MNKYLILTVFLFLNTTMVMSQKYETQEYEVVDQIDKIEIRYYPSAPMIRVSSNQVEIIILVNCSDTLLVII